MLSRDTEKPTETGDLNAGMVKGSANIKCKHEIKQRLNQQVILLFTSLKLGSNDPDKKAFQTNHVIMVMNNAYFLNKLAYAVHIIMAPVDDVYELYPLKHCDSSMEI